MSCIFLLSCVVAAWAAEPATSKAPLPRSQAFFGVHFDLHPNPSDLALGKDVTEEMVARFLDRVKPDYVQYDCKGHAGYLGYPSKVGPSAPHIVNDSLAIYRKVTRDKGVALLVHFSGLYDIAAIEKTPELGAVKADGQCDSEATSVFGPYVDRVMIPQLREVATQYDLDGAWVDGECWKAALDYSPAAMEAWKKETGLAEAPKKRGEPHWQEWKEFHRRHFEQYVAHWMGAVHETHSKMQLASNWIYSTVAPWPAKVNVDFISGDYDPHASVDRARTESRYMASTGKPWDLLAWGFIPRQEGLGWSLKLPAHLQQEAAATLMQGGGFSVYYQPTRTGYLSDRIIEDLGQVADFCRARQSVCHHSTSIPQVAVIFSAAAVSERSDRVGSTGGMYNELEGTLHALLELHYSVDVLAEHQIAGRVNQYPLVVLPDFEQFAPGFVEEVKAYVEAGGSLLLAGAKCARLFEPMLGVKLEGDPVETVAEIPVEQGIATVGGAWQKVTLAGAEVVAHLYTSRDMRGAGSVAATVNAVGRGRVVAVYGPVGLRFFQQHHPALRVLVGRLASRLFPEPAFTVLGPACLDVALRRTSRGQPALHLLNRAGMPTSENYAFADFLPPVGPVQVAWRLARKPDRVEWWPELNEPAWSWQNGVLSATIPHVQVHGVLVITEGK